MVKYQILDDQNSSIKELKCIDKYSDLFKEELWSYKSGLHCHIHSRIVKL